MNDGVIAEENCEMKSAGNRSCRHVLQELFLLGEVRVR